MFSFTDGSQAQGHAVIASGFELRTASQVPGLFYVPCHLPTMWVTPAGTTRGVLTKTPLVGNQRHLFIKEEAGGPKLEKGSLHSSLVLVSFSTKKVLPV